MIGVRSEFEDYEITKRGQTILKWVMFVLFFYFVFITALYTRHVYIEYRTKQLQQEMLHLIYGQQEYEKYLAREEMLKKLLEEK
jgi:hypothetical protein